MAVDLPKSADSVTVRREDLRLLLRATEWMVGSIWPANHPVVWAIFRMGDECLKASSTGAES